MIKAERISAIAVVGVIFIATPRVMAQLTEFQWNNPALVGAQSWQVDGNWNMMGWPDDPGRMEPDATIIVPSEGASLSVGLTGNLTLDVGATNVTVASLKLGGTAGAVTTNIISTGGKLVFENYEANNTTADPDICAFNCGQALVTSGGMAGSTNIISAPVQINGERLVFDSASTNNLTISGPVTFANLATAPGTATSIRSLMPVSTKLTISGSISLVDTATVMGAALTIHDNIQVPPSPPTTTAVQSIPSTGTIEISGVIQDTLATGAPFGSLVIGTTSANQALGTLILSGTNTYRGATTLNRANLVLANDSALGVDTAIGDDRNGGASFSGNQNPSGQFGFNVLSDNDSRTITIDARLSQWLTVTGSNSLTWAGLMTQSNARGTANLLPAGKTLTISGVTFGSSVSSTDTSFQNRIFSYDGTGTTVVTGGWRDKIKGGMPISDTTLGHFRKAGTGTVLVSDPVNPLNNDFTGDVIVDQGVMRFSTDAIFDQARVITSTGGAIGVNTGTFTNSTLLSKLESTDHGGLMLTEAEAAANISIDFTAGDLANAPNMSVAAPQGGASYDGTITPAVDAFTAVPTYRLGGGNGKLTLPGAKLTGARDVQITNGGEVELNGANTYTGVTTILAKYHTTTQDQAAANTTTNINSNVFEGTTLTVNNLASGSSSSIGGASDAASNLVIQGSTLKYKHTGAGSNGTTNRLLTIGTGGATLESASSAPADVMNFTNTGALVMDVAEDRTGTYADTGTAVNDGVAGTINMRSRLQFARTDDLVTGMGLSNLTLTDPSNPSNTTTLPAGAVISAVNSAINNPLFTYSAHVAFNPGVASTFAGYTGTGTVTIGGVARTLTLTGGNTGNNTLSSLIANATAATGTNTVNVAKNGTGKWILTGNNSYSGTTTVNAGTLLINGAQIGAGLTTVAPGATLGGTGTLGGALTNNGIVNPGVSVGTLNANGNVTMGANSHFAVELSGATADRLAITGDLDLAALGNFLDVTGVGTGSSWIIATYTGTLTGTFESVTSGYSVNYGLGTNSMITLNAGGGLPGDYNGNGKVDAADYVLWRKNPNAFGGTPGGYNTWRANFGNPLGSGSSLGSGGVPEPSGILLFGIALVSSICGVRRRRQAILELA